jgi:carboxypeptidase C (cathepsin A)
VVNPFAWNEVSNLLFLSQPIGVGFSYAEEVVGVIDPNTGFPVNSSSPTGRYSSGDPYITDTTALAANVTWEVLQAFIQALPCLDETVKSRSFNLWTESYGGHYGPGFFDFFYHQNLGIQNGSTQGVELNLHTLGVINGIINEKIQAPYYPEFAFKNTYGIETVNETIYNFMKMAFIMPNGTCIIAVSTPDWAHSWYEPKTILTNHPKGCSDSLDYCAESDLSTPDGLSTCAQATAICRRFVEGPYEYLSGLSAYDIRANDSADIPPSYWVDYLNTPLVRNAIGVNLNYSNFGLNVATGFDYTGDFVYASLLQDLEDLLDNGVRVALVYGDAVRIFP